MASIQYYDVILKPLVTEKSMAGMGEKKYVFLVHPDANKSMIKEAVENMQKIARGETAEPAPAPSQEPVQMQPARGPIDCPYCGATTTPDSNGCCEYCGSKLN